MARADYGRAGASAAGFQFPTSNLSPSHLPQGAQRLSGKLSAAPCERTERKSTGRLALSHMNDSGEGGTSAFLERSTIRP